MQTNEIRSAYLDFFAERGHRVCASSSLVPANDPTLLFTNAGMNQFKDALAGRESRGYRRAVSAQRCVRAGGKHNDLENVGYTARHHTFFEMLGNFSFGDYFKEDAIRWAWEFVTGTLAFEAGRLWVTIHPDDDQAAAIWTDEIGVPADRVVRHAENFWSMGDTGPCGPCSEIFYDLGAAVAGGPPGSADEDGDRYLEFWNLVFPQFDRSEDGTLEPLDAPGVDTGMGLERVAAILQGKTSSYEIDLFQGLIASAADLAGVRRGENAETEPSLRVIADHIRASAFLIADGVLPSNEDRGYVLRRIIRRALRHGHKLGIREPFFHRLVRPLREAMGDAHPVLGERQGIVEEALADEEQRFATTLAQGMALLNRSIEELDAEVIPGDVVFRLYDTYGFPADLTADVARESGLGIDQAGFDRLMEEQRARGRAASGRFSADIGQRIRVDSAVDFQGYEAEEGAACVVGLFQGDDAVQEIDAENDDAAIVVLDATPFYAEAGGQVGDCGRLEGEAGLFDVADTTRAGDQHLHHGKLVQGRLRVGDAVVAAIDGPRRREIACNHSATHLLHAALREVLGSHVEQRGSLVADDRLRFDFTHPKPVTDDEQRRIEAMVNGRIRANSAVETRVTTFDDAVGAGAMALFGEKYGDSVRLLTMGDGFSVELCGGTHVGRTGDIGLMRLVSETGIAAGVRRVEAFTGARALDWIDDTDDRLAEVASLVRGNRDDVHDKVQQLVEQNRTLRKEIDALRASQSASRASDLERDAVLVDGVKVVAATVEAEGKAQLTMMDSLKQRLGSCVVVLAHAGERVSLIAGVSKDLTGRVTAGDAVRFVGTAVGAKGGGRSDMARAGGGDRPEALPGILADVPEWVHGQLSQRR